MKTKISSHFDEFSDENYRPKFSLDERKTMIETMIKRVKGDMSDQDWEAFVKILPDAHKWLIINSNE